MEFPTFARVDRDARLFVATKSSRVQQAERLETKGCKDWMQVPGQGRDRNGAAESDGEGRFLESSAGLSERAY